MLFNFNNWNNSGKKEYDSKKKKKRKNYIHNFQQIFRPETISSNQFLYYIVHYKCNQCTKCSFIIQKHIYKGRRRGGGKRRNGRGIPPWGARKSFISITRFHCIQGDNFSNSPRVWNDTEEDRVHRSLRIR